jgi:hypothetical protein
MKQTRRPAAQLYRANRAPTLLDYSQIAMAFVEGCTHFERIIKIEPRARTARLNNPPSGP